MKITNFVEKLDQNAFAEEIKNIRKKHRYNQKQFGDLLGFSRASISAYENCERMPDAGFLFAVAKRFSISTDYLLGLSGDPFINNTAVDQLGVDSETVEVLRNMEDRKKALLCDMLTNDLFDTFVDSLASLEAAVSQLTVMSQKDPEEQIKERQIIEEGERNISQQLGYGVHVLPTDNLIESMLINIRETAGMIAMIITGYKTYMEGDRKHGFFYQEGDQDR